MTIRSSMAVCRNCSSQCPDSAPYCASCGSSREGPVEFSHRGSVIFAIALLAFIGIWEIGASAPEQQAAQPQVQVNGTPPVGISGDHRSTKVPPKPIKRTRQGSQSPLTQDLAFSNPSASRPTGSPPSQPSQPGLVSDTSPPQNMASTPLISSAPIPGVLGISGANWVENDFKGVEIIGVSPRSPAEIAGLHAHDVITEVDGQRIQTTEDLAKVLSQLAAGTQISLGYILKTNLGWMPKETTIILSHR
jgi:membrane-associated protease RseP (regulator of RpoE activity)